MKRLLALLLWGGIALAQNPITAVYPSAVMDDEDFPLPSNFTSTTLTSSINSGATTIPVASVSGMRFPTIIVIGTEVIKVCSNTSLTLNVCSGGRGLLDSSAASHTSGATVAVRSVDYYLLRAQAEIEAIQTALGANLANVLASADIDTISELQAVVADATLLTTADEGSGNGIDADTVDGVEAAALLPIAGGTLTGQLVTDNLGIEFAESDTNPPCSTGNYSIYADLSETTLKKCVNGTASDLDTGGGGGAPTDAQYWVSAADGTLSAEVVVDSLSALETAISATNIIIGADIDTISELQALVADATLLTTADEGSGNGIDADTVDGVEAAAFLQLSGGTMTGALNVDEANLNLRDAEDDTQLQLIAGALNLFNSAGSTQVFRTDAGGLSFGSGLTLDFSSTSAWNGSVDVRLVNNSGALNMSVGSGYQVGGVDVLTVAGGTLTGSLVADAQGVEFEESDDAVTCATGDYWIRADLSETTLKKCLNGTETVLDTTGGSPAFSDITGATNTSAAMVVGTGASLTVSGSGTINATSLSSTAIADFLLEAELDTVAELQAQIADATLLTTADEGSGNGIDADTVDGVEESAFLLIDGSRAMTGALVTDNLGIDITDSDTNPTCSAGEYKIYADTSETTLKKCVNGTASNLDTTGGTPAFSDITGATNTSAAMVVGTGASLTVSGSGTINATSLSSTALADFILETELDTIAELQTQIADATILTTADEGSGNGIDADTLDGAEGSAYTLDTEWDTAAEINAATSDDDFVTLAGAQTVSGDKTFSGTTTFSGSGPALAVTEQTAPGAGGSAGVHNVYIDSADSLLKSHENGGSVVVYALGASDGDAAAGDSATSFFDTGQVEAARGGTGQDTSASTGTPKVTAGTWSVVANELVIWPEACTVPASNGALIQRPSDWTEMHFSEVSGTGDLVDCKVRLPPWWTTGDTTVRVAYKMAAATSGNVEFGVSMKCASPGDSADLDAKAYDTQDESGDDAVPGTAGYPAEHSWTLDSANTDGGAAGDFCLLEFQRIEPSVSEATGEAEVSHFVLSQ